MRSRCVYYLFLISFYLSIWHVNGQTTPADTKRKASEYFCVAQCLGLLNAGGAPPGSASCYSGPLASVATSSGGSQCLSANFQMGMTTCCSGHPPELLKGIPDKCKTIMPPPMKMIQGYVINSGLEPANFKFDFTNADISTMVKKFGKQMLNGDGSINYDAAKTAMLGAVQDAWKSSLDPIINTCKDNVKATFAGSSKLKIADSTVSPCSPLPMLFQQCVRRALLLVCPTTPVTSGDCKQWDSDVRGCDPFKA